MSLLDIPWGENGLTVAVDTETSGLFTDEGARVSVISLAWWDEMIDTWKAVALPFDQGDLPGKRSWTQLTLMGVDNINLGEDEWAQLMRWLTHQQLVMHNAKFDLHMLAAGHRVWGLGVDFGNVVWDTMLGQVVLDPLASPGLKNTAARLWGEENTEEERAVKSYCKANKVVSGRYDLIPWEVVGPYATKDAELTLRLFRRQYELLETSESHLRDAFAHEMKLMHVLYRMEQRGIGFDVKRCRECAMSLRRELAEAQVGLPFKPTLAGARSYYFGRTVDGGLGLIPHKVSARGISVLDIDVLHRLVASDAPHARKFEHYRNIESALSKWYDNWPGLVGADGRIRASYNQARVVSGRLSVNRVQLQAIPHDYRLPQSVDSVRSLFTAHEGRELWELDISQAEIRVAVAMSKCQAMLEIVSGGGDVHGETAKRIFGIVEEHPEWKRYRLVAKRMNFGMLYGAGADRLRALLKAEAQMDVTEQQMQELLMRYHRSFPEFKRFARRADRAARDRGYVRLLNGRLRWFGSGEETHKAFNAIIQGNVAQAMAMWMIKIEARYPGMLLLQIHDSMVCEFPQKHAQQLASAIAQTGVSLLEDTFHVPFKVDAKEWR